MVRRSLRDKVVQLSDLVIINSLVSLVLSSAEFAKILYEEKVKGLAPYGSLNCIV